MSEREYVDGAFYWVKRRGSWTVGECDDPYFWLLHEEDGAVPARDLDEIGPCLGKEPPRTLDQMSAPELLDEALKVNRAYRGDSF